MAQNKDAKTPGEAARREARLAEALRANLRRRKDQARARGAGDTVARETGMPGQLPPEKP